MNINLLPQKFIKNRATEVIITGTVFLLIIFIFTFSSVFFFVNIRLNQMISKEQQANIEKIGLEKQVKQLKASQSTDIQEFLKKYKTDKYLFSPVMAGFEKTAKELDLKILNYQIVDDEGVNNASKGENGANESLLTPITMRLQGDLFKQTPKFKKALEEFDWVYDVMPVSVTNESGRTQSEFIIRLKKDIDE
ncbi:hypothetical protein ABG953_12530 [Enterococcus faecalis]|uniref:hypothetical protein n=1 Tax=Enterococcus faecalis TaxID=1351 RepID=UPI001A07B369|nr:hypothetical protein [Enterococcus faecalis]EGO6705180.1 hypothetical protein [Enterococcus faecalis]